LIFFQLGLVMKQCFMTFITLFVEINHVFRHIIKAYLSPLIANPFMEIIYILITVSLVIALIFLSAFFWSVRNGQFDDDYTPSVRMLFDDETKKEESSNKS
jgi:cbb3-type cytochrome oxidase maturation protein